MFPKGTGPSSPFLLPLFEIALVLVRFDHVASVIVNANHFVVAVRSAKAAESAA
jgi:hypothetical protein